MQLARNLGNLNIFHLTNAKNLLALLLVNFFITVQNLPTKYNYEDFQPKTAKSLKSWQNWGGNVLAQKYAALIQRGGTSYNAKNVEYLQPRKLNYS